MPSSTHSYTSLSLWFSFKGVHNTLYFQYGFPPCCTTSSLSDSIKKYWSRSKSLDHMSSATSQYSHTIVFLFKGVHKISHFQYGFPLCFTTSPPSRLLWGFRLGCWLLWLVRMRQIFFAYNSVVYQGPCSLKVAYCSLNTIIVDKDLLFLYAEKRSNFECVFRRQIMQFTHGFFTLDSVLGLCHYFCPRP
jgi:hypothetical protein